MAPGSESEGRDRAVRVTGRASRAQVCCPSHQPSYCGSGRPSLASSPATTYTGHMKSITILSLLFALGVTSGVPYTRATSPAQAPSPPIHGIFYNLGAHAGGTVVADLTMQPTVTGSINFTQRPEDPAPLCGAGAFTGTQTGTTIHGSFTSHDPDPGCGFDTNAIFTLTATVDPTASHLWGDYTTKNANGSTIAEFPGVFDLWSPANQPQALRYRGRFHHAATNQGGSVTVHLVSGSATVSGVMNFTNDSTATTLCGAGVFTGVRRSDATIELSFVSADPDPGCGFDRGTRFRIELAPDSTTTTTLNGIYRVGNIQAGTLVITLIHESFIPLAHP